MNYSQSEDREMCYSNVHVQVPSKHTLYHCKKQRGRRSRAGKTWGTEEDERGNELNGANKVEGDRMGGGRWEGQPNKSSVF